MRIQPCTVLMVGSTAAERAAYRHLLAADPVYDYTFWEAEAGAPALALCQETKPACILIAAHLPDMDGLTLLHALRERLGAHGTAFIMMASTADDAFIQHALQSGAHGCLDKDATTASHVQHILHHALEKSVWQREIMQQRAWLHTLAHNMGEGIIMTDAAGQITLMNAAATALTGCSQGDMMGQSLTAHFCFVDAQTGEPLQSPLAADLQPDARPPSTRPTQLISKSEHTTPVAYSAAPVQDTQGTVLGTVLILRHAQEESAARQEGEMRFRHLADAMPQIVWTATPTGVVDYFNEQWFAFTGLSVEASLADANVAIHPDDRAVAVAVWQAAQPQGTAYEYEIRLRRHDGIYHWFLTRCVPEYDAQGQVRCWFGTSTDITERKQAEEQLRYQAFLLENVQDAVISTDTEFRIVTWNRGAELLYGWLAEETIGRSVGDLLRTTYLTAQPTEALTTFMNQGRWQGEVMHCKRSGEWITVSNITVLLHDHLGRPLGAVAVNRDITARKAAEDARQRSEQLLRNIIDNVAAFVGLMTPDGILVEANRTALQAAHLTLTDVIGKHFADTYWWSYAEPVQAQLRAAIVRALNGETVRYDATVRLSDTSYIVIDFMLAPILDQAGQIVYLVPSAVDVTERRQAEAALRASAERLRLALAGGGMGIWEWHAATGRSIWDEQEYALFGLPYGTEITYAMFESLICQEDWVQLQHALDTAMVNGSDYSLEFRILRADGEIRWLAEHGVGIKDEQTQLTRLLGINFDITERKVQEEALHQLTIALEARVAERTAALKATNEKLEVTNHELEHFTYAAAHDLKSPLRGIQNLVQFLMEDAAALLPAKSQKHLSLLQGRAYRLEQLLNGLLDYSRIGREHYATETVATRALVEEISELLAPPAGFTITAAASLPTLVTHRVSLATVLQNLLSNAIKHHHQPLLGQVRVTARTLDNWIEFSVVDNGPGIDPEFHKRIFDMFQTLQSRDIVEGSGIGLALVKKIVENYGGQITVDSALGQGATFRFTWPKTL